LYAALFHLSNKNVFFGKIFLPFLTDNFPVITTTKTAIHYKRLAAAGKTRYSSLKVCFFSVFCSTPFKTSAHGSPLS
jgi:hypothetical protein